MARTSGFRFSPATLVLVRHGIRQRDIAHRLEVSQVSVGRYLAGHSRPHPRLMSVIRALAGPDVADEIADILGSYEEVL